METSIHTQTIYSQLNTHLLFHRQGLRH